MTIPIPIFIFLCILAIPGALLVIALISIPFWPRSDDRKFMQKEKEKPIIPIEMFRSIYRNEKH